MAAHGYCRKDAIIFGSSVLFLHVVGIGCLLSASSEHPKLIALGFLAYVFGLRHAFDADHIAAIDNTVRKLIQQKQNSSGVGFFFSLGHSAVVFLLAMGTAFAASWIEKSASEMRRAADLLGTGLSGAFLIVIGCLNLIILVDIYRVFRRMRRNSIDHDEVEELLLNRGFLARYLKPLFRFVNRSWHVFPIGFLFGVGFDTLTEIALFGITAGVSKSGVSLGGIIGLPLLFAAGMSLMDTADGFFMTTAYNWAFRNPVRKIFYNMTVTSLSVVVALFIGTLELAQIVTNELGLDKGGWKWLQTWDFGSMGYVVAALFVFTWLISFGIWKFGKIEERFSGGNRQRKLP